MLVCERLRCWKLPSSRQFANDRRNQKTIRRFKFMQRQKSAAVNNQKVLHRSWLERFANSGEICKAYGLDLQCLSRGVAGQ